MAKFFKYVVVAMATLLPCYGQEQIPATNLFTDTRYQIHQNKEGFSILTYASVPSQTGGKFVQMDDHADRESKYAPGGVWFPDGLWTFQLPLGGGSFVTIKHVLYPDYLLAVNVQPESPGNGYPVGNYLFLTADPNYTASGGKYNTQTIWGFSTNDDGGLRIWNLGSGQQRVVVVPRSNENLFYQWLSVTPKNPNPTEYEFLINGV